MVQRRINYSAPRCISVFVAASNAGGARSVLGDTTTTMMWIAGNLAGGREERRRLIKNILNAQIIFALNFLEAHSPRGFHYPSHRHSRSANH